MKICSQEYLQKVLLLSEEERERLLSRMGGKLPNRLEKRKMTTDEALAVQMEIEDEQLEEWRGKIRTIREKEEKKAAKKNPGTPENDAPAAA